MGKNEIIIKMQDIVKYFPGVCALNNVDFDLYKGEIHALIGENGAGKSTLVKILSGVTRLDHGVIYLNGAAVYITTPKKAQELGISIVFQESNLSPYLTVAQNVFVSHESLRHGFIVDVKAEMHKVKELLEFLSINIDPNELVANLSLGEQQLVAFVRALSFNPHVIILDEPTSSLTAQETEIIFAALKKLKKEGVGIIYISHRLEEIFQISDRVTVLRDGKKIDTVDIKDAELNSIIRMMVGRNISEMYPKEEVEIGEEVLRLEEVTCRGVCKNINLHIHKGEVVGLFGLVGAGRTEMMRLVFGLDSMEYGFLYLYGKKITHLSPSKLVREGFGFLPEDRKSEGLCLALSIKENIERASLDKLFPSGFISVKKEKKVAHKYIQELNIATPSPDRLVAYLSGGNQQKVVLGQWLCAESSILILDEPTRGIDVGAKVEIYRTINQLAKNGAAILIISSELPEVMNISDRVYVMCRGEITGEFKRGEMTAEEVAKYAFGTKETINENTF